MVETIETMLLGVAPYALPYIPIPERNVPFLISKIPRFRPKLH
jgi:hypothetical protein